MNALLKKTITKLILLNLLSLSLQAQVTIGSGIEPAKGALLDLKEKEVTDGSSTATKGIVFPRVELSNLTSLVPLLSAADAALTPEKLIHKGTVVYNVTTSADLQEGLYYWDGEKWISVLSATADDNNAWKLTGNTGTNPSTNYIGTSDNQPLMLRTNGLEAMRITADRNIGIGVTTDPINKFEISGTSLLGGNTTLNANVLIPNITSTTGTVRQVVADASGQLYANPDNNWKLGGNQLAEDSFFGTLNQYGLRFKVEDNERMRITTTGRVGINTHHNDLTNPVAITHTLTVNGDTKLKGDDGVFITGLPSTSDSDSRQLVVDANGRVKTVYMTDNSSVINYIQYTITNMSGDWIADFNTLIPVAEYTLVVVGSSLQPMDGSNNNLIVPAGLVNQQGATAISNWIKTNGTTVTSEVYAFPYGNTWRLYADYKGGSLARGNGKWTIYCLAINNAIVKSVPAQNIDLGGSTRGTAPKNPLE